MNALIQDLKEIFIFIGFALRGFFKNFTVNLFFIFLEILITTPVFFLSFRIWKNPWIFFVYLVVLMGFNYRIRPRVLYRNQLELNLMALHFVDRDPDFLRVRLPDGARLQTVAQQVASELKPLAFRPRTLAMARIALKLKGKEDRPEAVRRQAAVAVHLLFLEALVFVLLYIPFGLISFGYTVGIGGGIRFFIFLLGSFFVYFLDTAIIHPIVSVMVTTRLYRN
ncbi:MAG: hypothetical protein ACM3SY_03840 [Candidatus Omnitrophota bacterium]